MLAASEDYKSREVPKLTANEHARDKHAQEAAIERLWTHTVGITNRALARTGKDPASGLPAKEWERPGSSVAGSWRGHHFILTAGHVVENATVNDLGFFARPTPSMRHASDSEITMKDAFGAVSLDKNQAVIHRCDWEDLALITIQQDSLGPYLEFADIASSWLDPEEDQVVIGLSYPSNAGLIFQTQHGPEIKKAVLLTPQVFDGDVLSGKAGRNFAQFDPELHFLMPFAPASKGIHPRGISGAAAWVQSADKQIVWTPKFNFAGTYTVSYKQDGSIVQAVKASVVRRFLSEIFGDPTESVSLIGST